MLAWIRSGVDHTPDGTPARAWRLLAAAPAVAALLLAGCGDDNEGSNQGDGDFTAGDIEEALESGTARGVAEALRLSFIAEDVGADKNPRQIVVIDEAVDSLPGEPDVIGVADDDGDGLDDDGQIQVRVNAEVACVRLNDDGSVDVSGC